MTRLAAAGDRAGALAVGDRLRERLRTQLGIAPSPQTRALIMRLREDTGDAAPAPPASPGAEPSGLVGRDDELATLRAPGPRGGWCRPGGRPGGRGRDRQDAARG